MDRLKIYLLKIWPLLLIISVWFIFSKPYLLNNKVPFASTYLVNFFSPWNAYPGFSSPVKNNAMPDVIGQIYPWKNLTIDTFKNFQIPLWNPYAFSGTPHMANYQSAVLSPFNLLFFVFPFVDAWSILILLQPILAGIFMYLFLRTLKIERPSSLIGSVSFMFCGFITTWMAYGTLGYAILFLPLSLFAIEKFYQAKIINYLILLSFSIPLSFFSGHFQISIYFFLATLSYALFKLISNKNYKDFFLVLIYLVIGILLSLPQLLPSIELYSQSLRSGLFEKIEAIPFGYFPTFLAPDFLGNPVTRNDWFGHYAEWNAYIGVIPLIFAIYAVFRKKGKYVLFFTFLAIFSLLLSYDTPFLTLLVSLRIPVISTSAASRIIVLFSFAASVLAAFGIDAIIADIKNKKGKYLFYLLFAFGLVFLFLWSAIIFKLFIPSDKILIARQNFILPSILFISTSCILLFQLSYNKRIFKNINFLSVLPFLLVVLVSFEMLRFANKWMPFDPKSLMHPQVPVAKEFEKISGYERILSNLGGEATMYYNLPSIEGYDAVYIRRYGEFMASLKNGKLIESDRSVVQFPKFGIYTDKAVNLLGIKYIIHKISDDHAPWTFPFWNNENSYSTLYNDQVYQVLENKKAYSRTFLVSKYAVEDNPQRILNKMFSANFDLDKEVVLENDPQIKLNSTSSSANILFYSPNKINIQTKSDGKALLFLSDTYYEGWSAYVDGKKTPIYRADFTFRAVVVPEGIHAVEFIYNPQSFIYGVIGFFSGLGMLILLAVLKTKKLFLPKH